MFMNSFLLRDRLTALTAVTIGSHAVAINHRFKDSARTQRHHRKTDITLIEAKKDSIFLP
jgi:hypothetical protein